MTDDQRPPEPGTEPGAPGAGADPLTERQAEAVPDPSPSLEPAPAPATPDATTGDPALAALVADSSEPDASGSFAASDAEPGAVDTSASAAAPTPVPPGPPAPEPPAALPPAPAPPPLATPIAATPAPVATTSAPARRPRTWSRTARRILAFLFGILQALLIIRILLLFLNANPDDELVAWVLRITEPFVEPFRGMFSLDEIEGERGVVIDVAAIVALVAWTLIDTLLLSLLGLFDRGDRRR